MGCRSLVAASLFGGVEGLIGEFKYRGGGVVVTGFVGCDADADGQNAVRTVANMGHRKLFDGLA